VKPLEISFQERERNEASIAGDVNSYFYAAFGHLFIRMIPTGFDCRRMLPVKRGLKLRWCPEVQKLRSRTNLEKIY